MKIYNYEKEYWIIPDIAKDHVDELCFLKFKNNKFKYVETYVNFAEAKEVDMYELIFDNSKKTNIVYKMHKYMHKVMNQNSNIPFTNRLIVMYTIKEFEETFEAVLEKFNVDFLTR